MLGRVHLCLGCLLLAAAAAAQYPPPGLQEWGRQTYVLEPGEAVQFAVEFPEIPVRRWWLLVEGDGRPAHLNVRRDRDRSLLYDQRDETRHLVEVPWGVGERLSAALTAGATGVGLTVSIWGPPPDQYLRAYGYQVNRALEALARDDADGAREHLLTALRDDPDDPVAATLLEAVAAGHTGGASAETAAPPDTAAAAGQTRALREAAAGHLRAGEAYAALDSLGRALRLPAPAEAIARVYADLVPVHLALDNAVQARQAAAAAEALGLDSARVRALRRQLSEAEASPQNGTR
jgi:hypothetical protein